MSKIAVRKTDLIFPELSFEIVGCAFEVYNQLGFGHAEKIYQKALSVAFRNKNLKFQEQVYTDLKFDNISVGKFYLNFLIADCVIVEIKRGDHYPKQHIDQVNQYLKTTKLKLAILINFTSEGVKYKRLVNIL